MTDQKSTSDDRIHPLQSGERRLARFLQAAVVVGLVGLLVTDRAGDGEGAAPSEAAVAAAPSSKRSAGT